MRILFVHQNFPGQFKHLAPALVARGHEVLALTSETNQQPTNISTARYRWQAPERNPKACGLATLYAQMTSRGLAVARAANELKSAHKFEPDIVFGTPGWGETLFLKEVFPEATHILFAEFYYRTHGHILGFDPEFGAAGLESRITLSAESAHLLMAAHSADKLLSPTRYQAQSFPEDVHHRLTVIHDGIDTEIASPKDGANVQIPDTDIVLRKGDEVLTFINRNLERHRGFHIFMRALPAVLAARPNARAVIIGGDGESYSPRPSKDQSWKEKMLTEVGGKLDLTRVHFTGKVPYQSFIDLMRVTRAHAYFTYPFVLSWSMLEAMSCGALVVGSKTAPVQEVIEDGVNGRLVDFFDVEGLSAALIDALANPARYDQMRKAARETIRSRYDLKRICLPTQIAFLEGAFQNGARRGT